MNDEPSDLRLRYIKLGSTTLLVLGILIAFAYCLYRLGVLWHDNQFTPNQITAAPNVLAESTTNDLPVFPLMDTEPVEDQLSDIATARAKVARERQTKIDRVEKFFKSYGAELSGYGHIIVDQAQACGGDYRILVGIAGSESGLGRIMYKKYNPYGYLDGVQYASQQQALEILSCKVSRQHIAPCGQDLNCLARRYAGPQDDLDHFVSKVRWFMNQV